MAAGRANTIGALVSVAGGALLIVSAYLPWVTAAAFIVSVARNAFELGDGPASSWPGLALVALGVVAAAVGVVRLVIRTPLPWFVRRVPIACGVGAFLVLVGKAMAARDLAGQDVFFGLVDIAIGPGPYLALAAAVLTVLGGVVAGRRRPGN